MKLKSLGLKISLIVAMFIAVIITTVLYISVTKVNAMVDNFAVENAKTANNVFASSMQSRLNDALVYAERAAGSKDIVEAMTTGYVGTLESLLRGEYMQDLDIISICDVNGNVLVRGHSDQKGDNVLDQKNIASALAGKPLAVIEKGLLTGLAARGGAPIFDRGGRVIGAVSCGYDLSKTKYVDAVKESNNCEVTIFDGDTRFNTTLIDEKGNRVVGTPAGDEVIEQVLNKQQNFSLRTSLFGSNYAAYYSPLIVDGEAVGMLFAGVNIDSMLESQSEMLNSVIVAAIVAGVLSVIIIFVFSMFSVSKPLRKIGVFADKIRSGDIGLSSGSSSVINIRSADEVGVLARTLEQSYQQLQGYVREIEGRMKDLASGDFSHESTYQFQGDFILIKDSINDITRNLDRTIKEVNNSSLQVSSGSRQIADGAQALAQGSTEQAATVEQLSSSIMIIADKTKTNSEMTDKAAKLSISIKEKAERGNRQMSEMMKAVEEITAASSQIEKVIKVIDDIAFQTNILALNAAVEAARAGSAGKGFAVVAEEVRNLASKSAEAAKNTGGLIANSIEKANLGLNIAIETSSSLKEIVEGINESTEIVRNIAILSDEQAAAVAEVNTGINQVAQVVQQNSATAQESAAASDEMSRQADALEELISRFKL
ncbi:MAG: methyl-accepting chemotaxis protein [Eubacterium sp.]|jgi:methyl-accepting chemotaxis protein|nr:methyl-accepting chemotaxis protein [Eubacterium sp.]